MNRIQAVKIYDAEYETNYTPTFKKTVMGGLGGYRNTPR